jgi:NAD+ synthase (glutamine-hydrolysing)
MRIALAQLDPVVGDVRGNTARIARAVARCRNQSPDLVVFPELFLTGYPPRDLLDLPWFIDQTRKAVDAVTRISASYPETGLIVGMPWPSKKPGGKGLLNSAVLFHHGRVAAVRSKSLLPTYDVFDELRYFDPGTEVRCVRFKGESLGLSVCEDAWNDPRLWPKGRLYKTDPIRVLAGSGATLMINISSSPFTIGKEDLRFELMRGHARRHGIPFVYVNQVGANDELVFDGRSFVLDRKGDPVAFCPPFEEDIRVVDTAAKGIPSPAAEDTGIESVYKALVLGTRDYLKKCGFSRAVVGLSGGIDSAVTCCLAKAAIGAANVLGITMPSPYSSKGSIEDSRALARRLGVEFKILPITSILKSYLGALKREFAGLAPDVTEENIQARIRGNLLMAFSNKFGCLVLSTGNKSELAMGYCTLYGDMSGGLAVLSDVPKTMVYELAGYLNRTAEIIPREIILKPPSAELRPDQLDADSLPPYPVLDEILRLYIEESVSAREIIHRGFDRATVKRVVLAVDRNEYKRKQAAPGLKITSKSFGQGRRMPLAMTLRPLD